MAGTQALGISGQASLQRGQPSTLRLGRVCRLPKLGCRHREACQSCYCLCFHVHSASISRGNSLTLFVEHPSGLLGELGEVGLLEWLAVPHCWSSCEPWGSRSEDGLLQKSGQSSQVTETTVLCCRETPPAPHNDDSGQGHPWHLWEWTEAVQPLGPSLTGPGSHGLLSSHLGVGRMRRAIFLGLSSLGCRPRVTSKCGGSPVILDLDLLGTMRCSLRAGTLIVGCPLQRGHQGAIGMSSVTDFLEDELGPQTSPHSPDIQGLQASTMEGTVLQLASLLRTANARVIGGLRQSGQL